MVGSSGGLGNRFPVNNQSQISRKDIQETVTAKLGSEIPVSDSPTTNLVVDPMIKVPVVETGKISKSEIEAAWSDFDAISVQEEGTLPESNVVNPANVKVPENSVFTTAKVDPNTFSLISKALQDSGEQKAVSILDQFPTPVSPEIS